MKRLLIVLICGIFILCNTKVFANEKESTITSDKIKLTANKCNIRVENSDDDKIHYDYNKDKFKIETNEEDGILNIDISIKNPDIKGSKITDIFAIIKIPNKDYDSITMIGNEAGIGFLAKDINSDLEMTINDGAGSIHIRKGFDKTVNMSNIDSAGSITFEKGTTNYTINLKAEDSAVGSHLPNFNPYPNPVEYISGNGKAKINISLKDCSFVIEESNK